MQYATCPVYQVSAGAVSGAAKNLRPMRTMLLMATVLLAQSAHATGLAAETIGYAYDINSEQLLYSESHCVSADAMVRVVIYRDSSDGLIALKELSYDTGPTTPGFVQRNINTSDSVAVELRQGEVVMSFVGSGAAAARVVTKKPDAGVPLVVDAGFDAFVKANWESLLAGESKHFQFPFAARETLVELQIASATCSYEREADQCFTLELNNWLFRMLADPIELGYDSDLRRLTRFRGTSNITDAEGDGMVVDIHYQYTDVASIDCANE